MDSRIERDYSSEASGVVRVVKNELLELSWQTLTIIKNLLVMDRGAVTVAAFDSDLAAIVYFPAAVVHLLAICIASHPI